MHAASVAATRWRFSTSAKAIRQLSDDRLPPSNRATIALPLSGDKPSSGSVGLLMAGVASVKPQGSALATES